MNYIYSIIFGVVQGITEFLPISSSGHLVILHSIFDLPVGDEMFFDVVLHFATIFAVLIFFRKDIYKILSSWLRSFSKKEESGKVGWLIILGTIPAAFLGWFFEGFIEDVLRSEYVVVVMLVLLGVVFIVTERFATKNMNEIKDLSWKKTLLIGFMQALALVPGTSRSGATIVAGLWTGLKREAAIKFSFLLSVPIVLGASLSKISGIRPASYSSEELTLILVAFLFSFFSGYLSIKYFIQFARSRKLNVFAYYRFLLAIILLILLF